MCWSADKMCWSANKICWSTDYMCWSTKLIICVDLLTRCVDQLIRCVDQLISCGDQLTKRTVYISHLSQYSWLTRPAWGSRRYPGLWSADSRCQSRPRIDHRSARPHGTFAQRPNSTRRRKFQKVQSVNPSTVQYTLYILYTHGKTAKLYTVVMFGKWTFRL